MRNHSAFLNLTRMFGMLLALVGVGTGFCAQASSIETSIVILQALDKVTARIQTIETPIGKETRFGQLRILPIKCRKKPPEEAPDTAAFLQILETDPRTGNNVTWFSGWMFASTPALNALEHPVYDVWVKDCR
ncbi:MAG: DUF2155 domain-containing protein [Alphaproteobacteria bacterium]|nr:DUF2155 domain-containing protein [Alphaproteobacteria bacterium]